jgi:hypothetical protein
MFCFCRIKLCIFRSGVLFIALRIPNYDRFLCDVTLNVSKSAASPTEREREDTLIKKQMLLSSQSLPIFPTLYFSKPYFYIIYAQVFKLIPRLFSFQDKILNEYLIFQTCYTLHLSDPSAFNHPKNFL